MALALALLAGVAGVAYERLARLHVDTAWNDHTHLVLEAIGKTRVAMGAADAMRRSYRLSFDRADRELMELRIAEAQRSLDEVAALTQDNALQQAHIAMLRPKLRERRSILHAGIDLPQLELLPPAERDEQRAIQARGISIAKEIRDVFEAMVAEEVRLLEERKERALGTARSAQIAIVVGFAFGLGLVGFVYASLERENRRRTLAQAALAQSTLLVSAVVEGTSDLIAVKDRDGRYLLVNRAAAASRRRPVEDVLDKTDAEMMSPEAAETVTKNDREVMRSGEARVVEQHLVNHGEPRTFLSTKTAYLDPEGRLLGVIAVSRDITERKRLELAVAEQAIRDPLTGLFNRRYMDETLARELDRAQRRDLPVSVIMLDIDHFKRLNDTYGHAAGDAALRRFAQILLGSVRREDVPCRFGGEEFAVIMPEMPPDKARERAEAWRAEVEKMQVELGGASIGSVSVSAGVASFPEHGATGTEILDAADRALYRAKSGGRNRVVMAEPP